MASDDRNETTQGGPTPQAIEKAIAILAITLDTRVDQQPLSRAERFDDQGDPVQSLIESAERAGIFLRETDFSSIGEAVVMIRYGYAVVFLLENGQIIVLEKREGRKVECAIIDEKTEHRVVSKSELKRLLGDPKSLDMLVGKKELGLESMSSMDQSHGHHQDGDHAGHDHLTPQQRFWALLDLDRRDILLVVLFAGVAGVLALASPLVIEGLVNVVSWGTYFQPLLVLALMLLTFLGLAGVLKVLQTLVVETIQRRQFVRIVGDLSHRFPRANQHSLKGQYPRELANRVFDIMTIQKATSTLLIDGISIILTTVLGLILLAFYHPFLLGFDLVLVFTMVVFTYLLGRGAIRTAISESRTKYAVAHWLQDVISMPAAFKIGGGGSLSVERANQLTAEYIKARRSQFRVILRQIIFAVGLQVVASTALLGLGGWLVIDGQLTLGQLVASELVVTTVVGAFAKAGKALEKFYDMMAAVDKVGYLVDVVPDPHADIGRLPDGAAEVSWNPLSFHSLTSRSKVGEAKIGAGTRVAITGDDYPGKSMLAEAIAGLINPDDGMIQVASFDAYEAAIAAGGEMVGYAGQSETFHGTISDNVGLARETVSQNRVRESLATVCLSEIVLSLPEGLSTRLQSNGYPLSEEQQAQLMIARAIAARPRVLVINGLLDKLSDKVRESVWHALSGDEANWTLIVSTSRDDIAALCDSQISVRS